MDVTQLIYEDLLFFLFLSFIQFPFFSFFFFHLFYVVTYYIFNLMKIESRVGKKKKKIYIYIYRREGTGIENCYLSFISSLYSFISTISLLIFSFIADFSSFCFVTLENDEQFFFLLCVRIVGRCSRRVVERRKGWRNERTTEYNIHNKKKEVSAALHKYFTFQICFVFECWLGMFIFYYGTGIWTFSTIFHNFPLSHIRHK